MDRWYVHGHTAPYLTNEFSEGLGAYGPSFGGTLNVLTANFLCLFIHHNLNILVIIYLFDVMGSLSIFLPSYNPKFTKATKFCDFSRF